MNKYIVVFVALFALQGCLAKPRPDDGLDELATNAKNLVGQLGEQLNTIDTKKFGDALNQGNTDFLEQLNVLLAKVKTEIPAHKKDFDTAVETVRDNLSNAATKFKDAVGPDAAQKAEEFRTEFSKNVKIATDQAQKLYKDHEGDVDGVKKNIEDFTKNFFDKVVEISKDIQQKVKEEADKHEKTH